MGAGGPEIWIGLECSVVRVGDRVIDELSLTGHSRRGADLRRLADLGVRTVRYPALWEQHPDAARGRFDWSAMDRRLETMRSLGLRPVLGLLHQGTGRRGEMLDAEFPAAFASYAGTVARRYPWVDAYVPINEPLTTARFAGLYGHWYPHGRSDAMFASLVVNQASAFTRAARAIREVRPDALMLATEDAGTVLSTPELTSQARFERERRWLVMDAITGRVDRTHELRPWLRAAGAPSRMLDELAAHPEPPAMIGVHYYLTSDRFLDHRLARYPAWTHGGNGRQSYADVEAFRVVATPRDGLREGLQAAWARYRLPVALTEVHLGGPARERVTWWRQAVATADALVADGVAVAAVTAWSAFGSWEWPSLLTRTQGHYEPGLFDTRSGKPRPMALAREVAAAAAGRRLRPRTPGWWQRPDRLLYPPVTAEGVDLPRPRVDQQPGNAIA